jgi:predicted CopG family antitoxin
MEILMGCAGNFTDNEIEEFGYGGDVKTFYWNSDPDAQEDGFSEVIDELIRLIAILDGLNV